jgi:hypothetical protein
LLVYYIAYAYDKVAYLQFRWISATIKLMSRRCVRWLGVLLLLAYVCVGETRTLHAQTLESTNYRFDESAIGSGDLVQSSSANYSVTSTSGDLAIGSASSTNYNIDAGSKTSPDPTLSFSIPSGDVNFGNFTASNAATTTTTFSVSNYTSYGYVVHMFGDPPTNGAHQIAPMTTTGFSDVGTDQFGINLVANTSPVSFGANPDQGQFGFGTATANYNTSDQFRFVSGEAIASAPKSSGVTTYTISYLVNVASLTPGGKYNSNQTLVVTGTY